MRAIKAEDWRAESRAERTLGICRGSFFEYLADYPPAHTCKETAQVQETRSQDVGAAVPRLTQGWAEGLFSAAALKKRMIHALLDRVTEGSWVCSWELLTLDQLQLWSCLRNLKRPERIKLFLSIFAAVESKAQKYLWEYKNSIRYNTSTKQVKFTMSRIQSEIIRDVKRQESMIQNEKNLSTETKPKLTQMLELAESGVETR